MRDSASAAIYRLLPQSGLDYKDAEERGDALHPDSAILAAFKDYDRATLFAIKKNFKAFLARNWWAPEKLGQWDHNSEAA